MEFVTLAAALVSAIASVVASRLATDVARGGEGAVSVPWRWLLYLWPAIAFLPTVIVIFFWSPASGSFPAPEFYRLAGEVIPLLLIALMVEGTLVAALPRPIYIEFIATLLVGEIAAFFSVSGIFASGADENVGGGYAGTGILAMLTTAGLVGGALLVGSAALFRSDRRSTP